MSSRAGEPAGDSGAVAPGGGPGAREALLAFSGAIAASAIVRAVGLGVPWIGANLQAFIAVFFFYAPSVAARLSKRPFDYDRDGGFRLEPRGLNARVLGAVVGISFPLFAAAFLLYYGALCGGYLGPLHHWLGQLCGGWHGLGGARFALPESFWLLALSQVVVVAVPEELFFRGYLMSRFDARWKPRWRLFGADVGPGLLLSSLLFAVGHPLVNLNPQTLAVFFPGLLFGWMRARTGSIAAGAAYHALCNLYADVLHTSFFFRG